MRIVSVSTFVAGYIKWGEFHVNDGVCDLYICVPCWTKDRTPKTVEEVFAAHKDWVDRHTKHLN